MPVIAVQAMHATNEEAMDNYVIHVVRGMQERQIRDIEPQSGIRDMQLWHLC